MPLALQKALSAVLAVLVLTSATLAQEPDAVEAAPVAPDLPPICAEAGLSIDDCLALFSGFVGPDLLDYCGDSGVAPSRCVDFVRQHEMPLDCRSAKLTILGCVDFLNGRSRLYREQVKGLISQCAGADAAICDAAKGEVADLREQLVQAEAQAAVLTEQVGRLTQEVTTVTQTKDTAVAEISAAQATLAAQEVSSVDVCRMAALRLSDRLGVAVGDLPLDPEACALNPIAEVTRVLATGGAAPIASGAVAPAACVPLPSEGGITFLLVDEDALYGGLGAVRQDLLIQSLLAGATAATAIDEVWPKPLDEAETARMDQASALLCTAFPTTCGDPAVIPCE